MKNNKKFKARVTILEKIDNLTLRVRFEESGVEENYTKSPFLKKELEQGQTYEVEIYMEYINQAELINPKTNDRVSINPQEITKEDVEALDEKIKEYERKLKPFQKQYLGIHRNNANNCASQIVGNLYEEWIMDEFKRISNEIYLLSLKRMIRDQELEEKIKNENI